MEYDFANRPIRLRAEGVAHGDLVDLARAEVHRRRALFLARFPQAEQGSLAGMEVRPRVPLIVIVDPPPTERWGMCGHCGDPLPANRGGGCTLCHLALFSALRMDGRLPGFKPGEGASSAMSKASATDRADADTSAAATPEAPAPDPPPEAPAPDPPPDPEPTAAPTTSALDEAIALLTL